MVESKILVVDVQGFYINNNFIAKEISILSDDSQAQTFIIKPPFQHSLLTTKEKATNNWLYRYHHGLNWGDGESTLLNVVEYFKIFIMNKEFIGYVKGLEKTCWVKNLFMNEIPFYNLDDLECPNLKTLYKTNSSINVCNYHNYKNNICSEKNVYILMKFIKFYLNKEN